MCFWSEDYYDFYTKWFQLGKTLIWAIALLPWGTHVIIF